MYLDKGIFPVSDLGGTEGKMREKPKTFVRYNHKSCFCST